MFAGKRYLVMRIQQAFGITKGETDKVEQKQKERGGKWKAKGKKRNRAKVAIKYLNLEKLVPYWDIQLIEGVGYMGISSSIEATSQARSIQCQYNVIVHNLLFCRANFSHLLLFSTPHKETKCGFQVNMVVPLVVVMVVVSLVLSLVEVQVYKA